VGEGAHQQSLSCPWFAPSPACGRGRGEREPHLAVWDGLGGAGLYMTLSGLPSLPEMNGLHGWARTGFAVFHTTLNWPSPLTSPIITGLSRWWLSPIVSVKPSGALKVWPYMAARTLLGSVEPAFFTACAHMWMPT